MINIPSIKNLHLILVLTALFYNSSKGQIEIKVTTPSTFVECGKADTIVISAINNTATKATGISINIPFQTNMEFKGSVIGGTIINPSSSSPVFGVNGDSIAPFDTVKLKVLTGILCGYVSGPTAYIPASLVTSIGNNTDTAISFTAVRPNLVFSESPSGAISAIPNIDTITRIWTINQTVGQAHLKKLYINNDFNNLNYLSIEMDTSATGTGEWKTISSYTQSTTNLFISLTGNWFTHLGDNDSLLENGETVRIRTKAKAITCNPTSSYKPGFSCAITPTNESQFCEQTIINPVLSNFNSTSGNPILNMTVFHKGFTGDCSIYDTVKIVLKNTASITPQNTALNLLARSSSGAPNIFSKVDTLNNVMQKIKVRFKNGNEYILNNTYTYNEYFQSYTFASSNFDGAGGAEDLDGDGFYDDLAAGDSIIFYVIYQKIRKKEVDDNYGIGIYSNTISSQNVCLSSSTIISSGTSLTRYVGQSAIPTVALFEPSSVIATTQINHLDTLRASFYTNYFFLRNFITDSAQVIFEINLPIGVEIWGSPLIYQGNNIFNGAMTFDTLINLGGGKYHIVSNINANSLPTAWYGSQTTIRADFNLRTTCAYFGAVSYCNNSQMNIYGGVLFNDYQTTCGGNYDTLSYNQLMNTNPILVKLQSPDPCGVSLDGIMLQDYKFYRTTMGYTDRHMTTLVPAGTNDSLFLPGDSGRIETQAKVFDGPHDSLTLQFFLQSPVFAGNVEPILDFTNQTLTIYDSSTLSSYSISPSNYTIEDTVMFETNFESVIYSIKLNTNIAGQLNSALSTGDSISFISDFAIKNMRRPNYTNNLKRVDQTKCQLIYNDINTGDSISCIDFTRPIRINFIAPVVDINEISPDICSQTHIIMGIGHANPFGLSQPGEYRKLFDFDSIRLYLPNFYDFDTSGIALNYYKQFTSVPLQDSLYTYDSLTHSILVKNDTSIIVGNLVRGDYLYSGGNFSMQLGLAFPVKTNCNYPPLNPTASTSEVRDFSDWNIYGGDPYSNTSAYSNKTIYTKDSITIINGLGYNFTRVTNATRLTHYNHYDVDLRASITNITGINGLENLEIELENTSSQGLIKNVYLSMIDSSDLFNFVYARDTSGSPSYNIITLPNGSQIIEIDSISASNTLNLDLGITYDTCNTASFNLTAHYSCDSFPSDYNNLCSTLDQLTFSITPNLGAIETFLAVAPDSLIDICDTNNFQFVVKNVGTGATDSLNLIHKTKFSNSIYVSTNSYAIHNGNTYPLISTQIDSVTFSHDLQSSVLDSLSIPFLIPGDSIIVYVKAINACGIQSGNTHSFITEGYHACGEILPIGVVTTTNPINIIGTDTIYTTQLKLGSSPINISACSPSTTVDITLINLGGPSTNDSTRQLDTVEIIIPSNYSFINNSFSGIHNPPLNGTPSKTIDGNDTLYRWGLPNGVLDGDSIVFSIDLQLNSPFSCTNSNNLDTMKLNTYQYFISNCGSYFCSSFIQNGSFIDSIRASKSSLQIDSLSAIINACNDSLYTSFNIINYGSPIATGTPTYINFAVDTNNNSIFDNSDPVITGASVTFTSAINTNDTIRINHNFIASQYAQGEICNLIAFIDTNSCICDTSFAVTQVNIEFNNNNFVVCEGDSITFNLCTGTGNYPSRHYVWSSPFIPTSTAYLSDTNILNPTFYAPLITNDTTFVYLINVNKGSCISADTIRINVYKDTIAPVVICQDISVSLDSNGNINITPNQVDNGTYDACSNFSLSLSDSSFNCSNIDTNNIWLYATDIHGNIDSCQAKVIIQDNLPPELTCLNTQFDTVFDIQCEYEILDYTGLISSTDNCSSESNLTITQTPSAGTSIILNQDGTPTIQNISITTTDENGNTSQCNFDINIVCYKEIIIPQFISPNGDGKNDIFYIENIELFTNNTLKIFNRWGTLVYQKQPYLNDWNGKANSSTTFMNKDDVLPSGTYFYILNIGIEGIIPFTGYLQIQK